MSYDERACGMGWKPKFVEGRTWRIEKCLIEEDRAITDKGIKATIVRVYTLMPDHNRLIATSLFEEKKEGR